MDKALSKSTTLVNRAKTVFEGVHLQAVEIRMTHADLLAGCGKLSETLADYNQLAIELQSSGKIASKEGAKALNNYAHYLKKNGELERAHKIIEQAIELKAEFYSSHHIICGCSCDSGSDFVGPAKRYYGEAVYDGDTCHRS